MATPILVGHRGCNYDGINQNTLRAFKRVYDEGCREIELDIIPSADNKLFVFHNLLLDGVSTGKGPVMETGSSELKRIFAGHLSRGKDPIPTLNEVYDWVAGLPENERPRLQVELKGEGTGRLVSCMTRLYLDQNLLDLENLLVISFSRKELAEFKNKCPRVSLALLGGCMYRRSFQKKVPGLAQDRYDQLFSYPSENFMMPKFKALSDYSGVLNSGLIPDPSQRDVAEQMIASLFDGSCYDSDFFDFAKNLDAYSVNLWHKNVNQAVVDQAHESGFKVYVYTVDQEQDLLRMQEIGVDGVVTNFYSAGHAVYYPAGEFSVKKRRVK